MSFPVVISEKAEAQLRSLLARKGTPESFIRIGVKGGGCSGLEYVLKLETATKPIDLIWEKDTLKIVCDSKSATFLQDSTLVWTGNLLGGGFAFENPNAKRSCGCGTSFTPIEKA